MKNLCFKFLFFICMGLFNTLFAQTLSIKVLPAKAQKVLKDFVVIEAGTHYKGLFNGHDSLQCQLPKSVRVESFYLNRFEVTVSEYQLFLSGTGDPSNQYDSTVWTKDYPYSYNEPMNRNYFGHPHYAQYPIVGIRWDQAVRYCAWKTEQLNQLLGKTPYRVTVRLPSDSEWEYAAMGFSSPDHSPTAKKISPNYRRIYPWNGLFLQQEKEGHFFTNCNSGVIRTEDDVILMGSHSDGFLYTAPVKSFQPNNVGLYQMAGNVAEWTTDDYGTIRDQLQRFLDEHEDDKNANPAFLNWINALVPAERYQKYKLIKGGSWVDGAFYMQPCVSKIQDPDKATCSTGFRPVLVIEQQ